MRKIRLSQDRGRTQHDGVDARHTFSTGQYLDPNHMGFGPLRAVDEEHILPGAGYAAREYANMERVTIVLEGELEYRDSLGGLAKLTSGDLQCVSCGTGVRFSVANASSSAPLHSYTSWFIPGCDDLPPAYQNASFPMDSWDQHWLALASPDGRDGSLKLSRDIILYGASLTKSKMLNHTLNPNRGAWLQVIDGSIQSGGETLSKGDGLAIEHETDLTVEAVSDARLLLFDLDL
ncbi:MAG: pirin family protein [Pseudomonadota bacterium]